MLKQVVEKQIEMVFNPTKDSDTNQDNISKLVRYNISMGDILASTSA